MKYALPLLLISVSTANSSMRKSPGVEYATQQWTVPEQQREATDEAAIVESDLVITRSNDSMLDQSSNVMNFRNLQLLIQNDSEKNAFKSYEDLLESVKMVPRGHVDVRVNSPDIDGEIGYLMATHFGYGDDVIRGMTAELNLPFLSLMLQRGFGECTSLLICIFEYNRIAHVTLYPKTRRAPLMISPRTFGVNELNKLLRQKWIRFQDYEHPMTQWVLNKHYCTTSFQNRFFSGLC